MTSLMTRGFLLERYGPRLSVEQIAEVLGIHVQTVYNLVTRGELGIPTYKEGIRRYASYEAVAEYLEKKDAEARAERA